MTDADKINILIKEGEGLTVEYKERYTSRIDRDIVAFANSKGGLLLLGVDDAGRVAGEKLTNLSSFLTSLSIYRNGKINNAGALMFASKVEKFVPHAESIFASFKGTDKTNIYDRNDVRDDLLTQFGESVAFFKKHLNIRSEIRGFDRFDIYEIPLDALREAVVNSIIHRDYAMKGTSIYVRIYDDRVEIENPGGLSDGITRRDFGKSSVRRNPIIADMFHRMGKVERMGSGIERMRELMRDAGLKEPVFEMDAFFRVTFYRDPRYSLKADKETAEKTMGKGLVEKGGEDTEKIRRKLGEKLGENEKRILEIINKNKFITIPELSKTLDISTTAVENNLAKLKVKNILKRIGPDKGGHWEIVNV